MNVYFVVADNWSYDEYDSCIVVARGKEDALKVANENCLPAGLSSRFQPHQQPLTATKIDSDTRGIVSSSFNADRE